MIDVPSPETQFDIDEYNDLYAKTKPTLYVKMGDIFAVHRLIATDVATICPDHDDVLRAVVREVGSAQRNETELAGVGSSEICLTLNPKLHNVDGEYLVTQFKCGKLSDEGLQIPTLK